MNGTLLVNADDWGWTRQITDRILDCYRLGGVHRASGLTFMSDSRRAAELALGSGLEVGLHLNLTQALVCDEAGLRLRERHGRVASFLKARKANQLLWNPLLRQDLEYVVKSQWAEFERLYGFPPPRMDGHEHMHLCACMLFSGLIPRGLRVRRNFTFAPGEKSLLNRLYRKAVDRWLNARGPITDYFFSLVPVGRERLERIIGLSASASVELMVHPGVEEQYRFLRAEEWRRLLAPVR